MLAKVSEFLSTPMGQSTGLVVAGVMGAAAVVAYQHLGKGGAEFLRENSYYREQKTSGMQKELHDYVCEVGTRPTDGHRSIEAYTAKLGGPARMQSAPEQGSLMTILVKMLNARRVLDVGMFTGYSTLNLALGLGDGGKAVTVDVDMTHVEAAREGWKLAGVEDKVEVRHGRALDVMKSLQEEHGRESFDLVFLDADKSGYVEQYEFALELLRSGGLVLVDNTIWSGRVISPTHLSTDKATIAIRALNDHIRGDPRVDISLIPVADGLTIARKK